jgi:murein peptide amidase A
VRLTTQRSQPWVTAYDARVIVAPLLAALPLIGVGPFGPTVHHTERIGRSAGGRAIVATESGAPAAPSRVLVVGCIHGNECAGIAVVRRLRRLPVPETVDLWLVPTLNPDGRAADTRQNGHGVDLNRNFPAGWSAHGTPWSTYYSGPRPFSEPETRAARRLILTVRPTLSIWYHQHMRLVWAWGRSTAAARRYAAAVGLPLFRSPSPGGTASRWQNAHFPGASFAVELPAGRMSRAAVRRHEAAILALAG